MISRRSARKSGLRNVIDLSRCVAAAADFYFDVAGRYQARRIRGRGAAITERQFRRPYRPDSRTVPCAAKCRLRTENFRTAQAGSPKIRFSKLSLNIS